MKKLAIILTATVVFTLSANAQKDFISANMYGVYHNELVGIYLEKYKNNPSGDFLEIYNRVVTEFEKKHPNVLSKQEKEFYAKRISEIMGTNTDAKTFNFNTFINAGARKYYSAAIQSFLIDVFDKNESPAVNLEKISSLKKQPGLSAYDINELNKFESLLKASNEFWSASPETSSRCCARCQVMIADFAGGMFGELGSVGYSVLVNYMQDTYHNGGCI